MFHLKRRITAGWSCACNRKYLPLATCVGNRRRNPTMWMNGSCDNVKINEAFFQLFSSLHWWLGRRSTAALFGAFRRPCVTSSCCLSAPLCGSYQDSLATNQHANTNGRIPTQFQNLKSPTIQSTQTFCTHQKSSPQAAKCAELADDTPVAFETVAC